jgi:RNA polymerase sigma-70 factor (ECF subfamily)
MDDNAIINLYNCRDESAIAETASKYGSYCTKIAMNVLRNRQDADECVNDTWLKAWNAIPPQVPAVLSCFLGRITRNLALNVYNAGVAKKRGGEDIPLIFEELEDCVRSRHSTEEEFDARETKKHIDEFLKTLKDEPQTLFIRRYWHAESIAEICKRFDMSESKVKSMLARTRQKLKVYLEERGVNI